MYSMYEKSLVQKLIIKKMTLKKIISNYQVLEYFSIVPLIKCMIYSINDIYYSLKARCC
jgi:hypothetical protein